jgi:hypothetical protein
VMGAFIMAMGLLFLFPIKAMQPFIAQYEPFMIKLFAGLCFIYGAFRIYRGYVKNYFRD